MQSLDRTLKFTTQRFDYTSDLLSDYNAGNCFYGRDLAVYLCEQLKAEGVQVSTVDEDWGWLVFGEVPGPIELEVAIYNLGGPSGDAPGPEWGLWIQAFRRGRVLGLIPKRIKVSVPSKLDASIEAAIRMVGATPIDWLDGPGG